MTIRTSSRIVSFTQPFVLSGVDGVQPAGTYTVETDEELLETVSLPAYRRTMTRIRLRRAGVTEFADIDPGELETALARDAMPARGEPREASLDDLLADDVMRQAVHSAGLTPSQFRQQLRALAARLRREPVSAA